MSRILFINGNVHGHINPTLPVVRELADREQEVHYFSTVEFKPPIEAAGAVFHDYGETLDRFLGSFRPTGDHPFYLLMEFVIRMDRVVVPLVMERIRGLSFDILVHDSMLGGGKALARRLGIPAVCSSASFAADRLPVPPSMLTPGCHPQLDEVYRQLEAAAAEWAMDSPDLLDIFFKKEPLNIVYTSRMFQPSGDGFDGSFRFVGPSIADRGQRPDFTMPEGRPLLYISLGTINNRCPGFYRHCMEAFAEGDITVVLSVGGKTDPASLGPLPGNFIVRSHVPQLEVLQKADAFITHGGLGSVSEALYYGVPLVVVPQANDQPAVARQVAALGAGLTLKMEEITPAVLREAVEAVLSADRYRQCSQKIGESFQKAGGYRAASDVIMEAAGTLSP